MFAFVAQVVAPPIPIPVLGPIGLGVAVVGGVVVGAIALFGFSKRLFSAKSSPWEGIRATAATLDTVVTAVLRPVAGWWAPLAAGTSVLHVALRTLSTDVTHLGRGLLTLTIPRLARTLTDRITQVLARVDGIRRWITTTVVPAIVSRIGRAEVLLDRLVLPRLRDLTRELERIGSDVIGLALPRIRADLAALRLGLAGLTSSATSAIAGLLSRVRGLELDFARTIGRCRGLVDRLCGLPADLWSLLAPASWVTLGAMLLQRTGTEPLAMFGLADDVVSTVLGDM